MSSMVFYDTRTNMADKGVERLKRDESLGEKIDTLAAAAKSRFSGPALAGVGRSTVFEGNHRLRDIPIESETFALPLCECHQEHRGESIGAIVRRHLGKC